MSERTTSISKTIEYEIDECVYCNDDLFVDENVENVDRLPEGIRVTIGGGKHISSEKTPLSARMENYRTPRVIIKWFGGDDSKNMISSHYMCPSCAKSVYGFQTNE